MKCIPPRNPCNPTFLPASWWSGQWLVSATCCIWQSYLTCLFEWSHVRVAKQRTQPTVSLTKSQGFVFPHISVLLRPVKRKIKGINAIRNCFSSGHVYTKIQRIMPLKVQVLKWRFVHSRLKSRSHLQQNWVCFLSSLAISWFSASYCKQFGEQAEEMSEDEVSVRRILGHC